MVFDAIVHVFEHWKTSLAGSGLGAGVFAALQAGCGKTSWKAWSLAVAVALLGFVAKDPQFGAAK